MTLNCLLTSLLIFSSLLHAEEPSGPTRAAMHTFLLEISKIRPYLSSDAAFGSEKGRATILEALNTLDRRLKTVPRKIDQAKGFRITFSLMADHIGRTKALFEKGEYQYARNLLNGTTNFCVACHTQSPTLSKSTPFDFFSETEKSVTFESAMFLFVTRRYSEALSSFDVLVRGYPQNKTTKEQLFEIMRKKLAVFARVERNPAVAQQSLKDDLKNSNLPPELITSINGWIKDLARWQAEKSDPAKLKSADLIKYVAKNLPKGLVRKISPTNPDTLKLLRLSGLLYERLYDNENEDPNEQALLFYLAACERSLSPIYWYSINEIYLKECVIKYPKQAYSKRCFEAYEDGMKERFSAGSMPESIRQSIEALKAYL